MESSKDPGLKTPVPADETQLDLYTIPSHSSWFSWDDIHDVERISLKEFFDGSSITRNPKIYKDYRDFIISKYREDPSRRLTFTEIRKSLVGDVCFLHKVFSFLDNCGLINFGAPTSTVVDEDREDGRWRVRVEEGAPYGVRVVALPNSLKPLTAPPPLTVTSGDGGGDPVDNGFKLSPLASHSDVYGQLAREKCLVCRNCQARCDSGYYEYSKDKGFLICVNCFKTGNYGEKTSAENFRFIDHPSNSGSHEAVWTEAETLLLLESVLKHGDDWDLVAQNVQTKSKLDCISKLLQLPFGELMLGSANGKGRHWESNGDVNNIEQVHVAANESQETSIEEYNPFEPKNETQQNGDVESQGPPLKRLRISPITDASSLLLKQASVISTMVGPHITASVAEAAVSALCHESLCPREIFDGNDYVGDEPGCAHTPEDCEKNRTSCNEDSEAKEKSTQSELQETSHEEDVIPLTLRMRAATATALGSAAAHAKLLADQEDREIEHLVANIIEMQLKKLRCKVKHFDDLELIMEKEHALLEELEESLIAERLTVLQRLFSAGISRWRDPFSVKPQMGSLL